jgi:hypothetical protein
VNERALTNEPALSSNQVTTPLSAAGHRLLLAARYKEQSDQPSPRHIILAGWRAPFGSIGMVRD